MHSSSRRNVEEPFMLMAIASLFVASLWMWYRAPLLLQFFYSNELLALTHTLTLGFVTALIMGVLYRIVPVALMVQPKSQRLGTIQFGLYFIGVLGMVYHFYAARWNGLAWSAVMVWLATLIQLYNWRGLCAVSGKGDWTARYAITAIRYLALASTLGVLMGFAKGLPQYISFPHTSFVSNLYVHMHLAGLGWVTNMVFGFHLRLWPRSVGDRRFLASRYWLLQIGIVGLVVSQWTIDSVQVLFAAMILIAIGWQGWGPMQAFFKKQAREWEMIPMIMLFGTAIAGVGLSLGWPPLESSLRSRVQMAYGFVGMWGWFVLTINIFVYKLFPMWVWQERFQKDLGTKPVPAMSNLYSQLIRRISLTSYSSGIVLTVIAILISSPILIRISLGLVFLGTACFVTNFVLMARWKMFNLTYNP